MTTKHTPGPWIVHPFYPGHVIPSAHASRKVGGSVNPNDDLRHYAQVIVWVDPVHRHRERDEQVANARLIAAAPELLEAVRTLAEDLEDGHWSNTKQWLRELAAKAEGA